MVVDWFEQAGPGVVPVVLKARDHVGKWATTARIFCEKSASILLWKGSESLVGISRIKHYQPISFELNPEIPAVLNSDGERPQRLPYHIGCSPLSFGALYDSSGGAPRRGAMRKEPQEMEVV